MIHLGVNIDHVATVRQARGGEQPSVLDAARIVASSGADSITVHLREDRRHIQDYDVYTLRNEIQIPLNLEMALSEEIITIALAVVPDQITLVPERRRELTTEGGIDVLAKQKHIERTLVRFKKKGIRVSLFINPSLKHVRKAAAIGADAIELHTGRYADSFKTEAMKFHLNKLITAATVGGEVGLHVHAGHGLDYENVRPICRLPNVEELNIGFSIIAKSLFIGLSNAVVEMKRIMAREYTLCHQQKSKKK